MDKNVHDPIKIDNVHLNYEAGAELINVLKPFLVWRRDVSQCCKFYTLCLQY
jgi:hypothetical protein